MSVYVVQEPTRRDPRSGVTERLVDLSPASEYGDIVHLLPSIPLPLNPGAWIPKLRTGLSKFCDEDYLLPVGDMSAITTAAAIAAQHNNGRFKVLRWNRKTSTYSHQQIDIYGDAEAVI